MRRREFIAARGGAAAWPLAARGQQPALPVIGFLRTSAPGGFGYLLAAFGQGLAEAGFSDGRNVSIDYRWAEDRTERLPGLAAELVRRHVAVIVANSNAAEAAKAATPTIPVIFVTGADPIASGLVTSLSRPSENVTGIVFFNDALVTKRLQLLHDLVPRGAAVGLLFEAGRVDSDALVREASAAARAVGRRIVAVAADRDGDLDAAFATFVREGVGLLVTGGGAFLSGKRERIVALASRHAIPTVYPLREYAAAGGLMSYGTSLAGAYRDAGVYAGRILKGVKPAELPVQQSTKFELVINLNTAKALGLALRHASRQRRRSDRMRRLAELTRRAT